MVITITQQPDSTNLILYPDGDDTIALDRNTGSYNYECVDDIWHSPDEDTTYVYTTSETEVEDRYTLQDHGTETGTINYVRLMARAKSHTAPQESSGIYRLILQDNAATAYSDNFAPLSYTYDKKYYTWTEKPSGGSWTWSDIDDIIAGIECNSPLWAGTGLEATFRPYAAGDLTEISNQYPTTGEHWDKVDEETADEDSTYIYRPESTDGWERDLFEIPDHDPGTHFGNINNITVYIRVRNVGGGSVIYLQARAIIKIAGNIYQSGIFQYNGNAGWNTRYYTWDTNPATGSAWTWSDIDSLQIGVNLGGTTAITQNRCTQVYMIVNYDKNFSPEIRTTQLYTVVNYVPPAATVTLNDPSNLEMTHSRRIQRFLFGSGDYEVSDFGRGGKTLSLSGTETEDTENKMNTLKTMTHYGKHITITGLPDPNLDGDYYITDFNWNKREGYVDVVDWNLILEEA